MGSHPSCYSVGTPFWAGYRPVALPRSLVWCCNQMYFQSLLRLPLLVPSTYYSATNSCLIVASSKILVVGNIAGSELIRDELHKVVVCHFTDLLPRSALMSDSHWAIPCKVAFLATIVA